MGTWSISPENSGGTINASTGEATFGRNSTQYNKIYTITYTDDNGCTASTTYTVESGETCQPTTCFAKITTIPKSFKQNDSRTITISASTRPTIAFSCPSKLVRRGNIFGPDEYSEYTATIVMTGSVDSLTSCTISATAGNCTDSIEVSLYPLESDATIITVSLVYEGSKLASYYNTSNDEVFGLPIYVRPKASTDILPEIELAEKNTSFCGNLGGCSIDYIAGSCGTDCIWTTGGENITSASIVKVYYGTVLTEATSGVPFMYNGRYYMFMFSS